MLSDKYISDAELDNIKKVYCDKIVLFKQFRKEIKKWYADFDFQYPHSSENNYRRMHGGFALRERTKYKWYKRHKKRKE